MDKTPALLTRTWPIELCGTAKPLDYQSFVDGAEWIMDRFPNIFAERIVLLGEEKDVYAALPARFADGWKVFGTEFQNHETIYIMLVKYK